MKNLIVILVDAFRFDYLGDAPFLTSLGKEGWISPLKPILGYSDAIRATVFTGTNPDVNNYWMSIRYSPETSPFRSLKSMRFIDNIPSDFIKRGLRFTYDIAGKPAEKKRGYGLNTHVIPFKVIDKFDVVMRKSMLAPGAFGVIPSIFDVFRDNKVPFTYITNPRPTPFHSLNALYGTDKLVRTVAGLPDYNVVWIYMDYLDAYAHRHAVGPDMKDAVREVDRTLEQIVTGLQKKMNDSSVIIFSDHGMAQTKEFINFNELTSHEDYGKEFLCFLDSTMVRIWYLNPKVQPEIRAYMNSKPYGHFLSQTEKLDLGIAFKNRFYGDDIYLIGSDYSIFPNYMSFIKPLAMHAYHPDIASQAGIFLMAGKDIPLDRISGLVRQKDIMPTALEIMGLPAPTTCQGISIIKAKK